MSTDTRTPGTLERHHVTRARLDSEVTRLPIDSMENLVLQQFFSALEGMQDISSRETAFRKAKQTALAVIAGSEPLSPQGFERFQESIDIGKNAIYRQMAPGLALALA